MSIPPLNSSTSNVYQRHASNPIRHDVLITSSELKWFYVESTIGLYSLFCSEISKITEKNNKQKTVNVRQYLGK